jgi:hypothetical protein
MYLNELCLYLHLTIHIAPLPFPTVSKWPFSILGTTKSRLRIHWLISSVSVNHLPLYYLLLLGTNRTEKISCRCTKFKFDLLINCYITWCCACPAMFWVYVFSYKTRLLIHYLKQITILLIWFAAAKRGVSSSFNICYCSYFFPKLFLTKELKKTKHKTQMQNMAEVCQNRPAVRDRN